MKLQQTGTVGETLLFGLEVIQETNDKVQIIQERIKTAHSRHKSYADHHKRDLEFQKWEKLFLKVSPMKGVMRFGKKWQEREVEPKVYWTITI
ncbi:hypothetical protein RND71_006696 [Anisodus tanguticus]|uniref:Reverse transcriptase domain-containing protein n=1 Tax=Anisodus tanguticus TaxID=243964 RepID=A0AAE1SSF6_9SOLA|nr:hypothetical protein RND71_006696 [Anisodus tanguticus]